MNGFFGGVGIPPVYLPHRTYWNGWSDWRKMSCRVQLLHPTRSIRINPKVSVARFLDGRGFCTLRGNKAPSAAINAVELVLFGLTKIGDDHYPALAIDGK